MFIILKLVEKFKKFDKNIKMTIILSFILILLVIGTSILKSMSNKDKNVWNYNEIKSAKDLLYYGEEINNRNVYWNLKEIINDFISTSEDKDFEDEDSNVELVEYTDYYEVLTKKYKRYLSRDQFKVLAKNFIDSFLLEDHLGNKYATNFIIESIYMYDRNEYLCVLKNIDIENDETHYIGINLNEEKLKFSIFYIE